MEKSIKSLVLISILALGFVSLASADQEMDITAVDEPFSLNETGVNTTTVQVVRLNHSVPDSVSWGPVTGGMFKDGSYYDFFYNESEGNSRKLEFLEGSDGYWYAEFKPNFTSGDLIKYSLNGTLEHEDGDVYSESFRNITEDLNVGDLELSLENTIDDSYKAGEDINVEVSVENASTGNYVDDSKGSVEVFFSNRSGKATSADLANYDNSGNHFYNSQVPVPDKKNSTYIMHVNATNSSGRNPHGTLSKVVKTDPLLTGEISLESEECTDIFTLPDVSLKCEQGANISVSYSITASSANSVNLTTYAFNVSESGAFGPGRQELDNMSLKQNESNNDHFYGNYNVPDINTSTYNPNLDNPRIEFEFKATNSDGSGTDKTNISLQRFSIDDRGEPISYLNENYELKLLFSKYYSNEPYSLSRFKNITINVTDPSDNLIKNFTKSELTYDANSGLTKGILNLESNYEAGAYSIEGEAFNIYERQRTISSGFTVKDLDATFNISDTEFTVSTLWSQNFTTDIENLISEENNLSFTDDLPEEINLINNSVNLESDEKEVLEFEVNLTEMEDVSGDLTLSDDDTEYNKTVEISVNASDCSDTSGKICSKTSSPIDVKISNSSENVVKDLDLLYTGPVGEKVETEASITGNISNHLEIEGEKDFNLSGERTVVLNYTASQRGNFSGSVLLETDKNTLEINTSLDANVTAEEEDGGDEDSDDGPVLIADPSSIDLGYFPEGDNKDSEAISVTNEGDEELSEISSSSETYSVTLSGADSIGSNETADLTLEFESVESESGDVTISAGDEEVIVSVSANPVPNYKDLSDNDLRPRMNDLRSQTSDSDLESDLTGVSTKIEEIKTAWDSGNYQEAQTLYQEADQTLQSVSSDISSGEGSDNNGDGESSGGIPILPVAGGILFILIILFVFLTSYVPEEGDPLYGILGEG